MFRTDLEILYSTVIESVPFSIIWVDLDGTIINSNSATEKIFGYTKEDLKGNNFAKLRLYPFEFLPVLEAKYKSILSGESGDPIEIQAYKKDGSLIWVKLQGYLIQIDNNTIIQMVNQDITDQINLIEMLKENRDHYKDLIEGISDALMVYSSDGRFLDCNELTFRRLGYDREEFLSLKDVDIVHPKFHKLMHKTQKELWDGKITIVESAHCCKDGRVIPVEVSTRKINYNGVPAILAVVRDITDRKMMEAALLESKEKYRELADSITDIFFAMDKDLRYTYWNRASEQLTHIPAKEAIGKTIFEVFPDDEETGNAVKVYREVLESHQSRSFVNEFHLEGNQYFFEINAYPTKEGLSVFVKDITERRHVEELLQESEKKYRNIIENVRDAVVIIGLNGKFHFISPQFSEILGRSELGEDFDSIIPLIHEDDVKRLLNGFQKAVKAKMLLEPEEVEFRVLHQDGHYVWLASSSKIHFNENGNMIGYIVSLRDITARKQAEEELKGAERKFRTLFENGPAAITLLDKSGNIIDCNKAIEDLVGYTREEIIGKHFENLITINSEDFPKLVAFYEMVFKGIELEPFDLEIIIKSGERRWINVLVSILKKESEVTGFQIIATDITARKNAERQLEKAIKDLKELDRLKDEFYTDISHELRTPLTAIRGFAELLLQSNNLTEDQTADLQTIQKNEVRIERMVNNILEYSRLKSGRIQFKEDKFRVSEIYIDLKKELEPLITQKQLIIVEKIHPDEEIILDREYIISIIKNLFTNAIKFSFPNGKIIINSKIHDGEWIFSIRDFGIGIAKEDMPTIFNRFIKLKASEMMNPDGIGIGLTICKNIIDAYRGKIWAESAGLNKGAKFIFQLKCNKSEEENKK